MFRIQTILEMENLLLQGSKTKDLVAAGKTKSKAPGTKLTAQQVRHEVSIFARVLVNVYCGWPFHKKILKRKILKKLIDIYNNAHAMTSLELINQLKPVIEIIPDNHINLSISGHGVRAKTGLRKLRPNVGSNVAGNNKFVVKFQKDIGVIGVRTLIDWTEEDKQTFEQQWRDLLPKVKILIIDLRNNSGGGSLPIDLLCRYILGARYPIARKMYVRNNPDANAVKNFYKPLNVAVFDPQSDKDPAIYKYISKKSIPKFDETKAGFNGPIYVLINGDVMSAAEIVCTNMQFHPKAKLVGTNTCGGEVYGNNYAYILFPHSNMIFNVGCVYRELFVKNFELNGYNPDIKCPDGTDAMNVALADIKKQKR